MKDVGSLHWGIDNSKYKLPFEYLLTPPCQGAFAQQYAEPVTTGIPDISSIPSFESGPGDHDPIRDVCDGSNLDPNHQSVPMGGDGSFDSTAHTKDAHILDFRPAGIWAREASTQPSQNDTPEYHDLGGSHQYIERGDHKDLLEAKLRSASHKPKNLRPKRAVAPGVEKARSCHNKVEKKYRARLKMRFERLLAILQAPMPSPDVDGNGTGALDVDYYYSRGEVLDLATEQILILKEENARLTRTVRELNRALK
ncbi:unnamed protein product [Fusarium langsethiae]|nr:unnamed protein product [Fusarium langsethiae]